MAETGLSAPEAFVLSSLPHYDIRQTLKLGFMGLLAQGILRSEEETRPGVLRAVGSCISGWRRTHPRSCRRSPPRW